MKNPVELLLIGIDVEPVPGIPAYVVEVPDTGGPVCVVDTLGGNTVLLLHVKWEDEEESGRELEVHAVDVILNVALEPGWLGLVVVEDSVGVLLLSAELVGLDVDPGMLLRELGQPVTTVTVDGKKGVPSEFAEIVMVVYW